MIRKPLSVETEEHLTQLSVSRERQQAKARWKEIRRMARLPEVTQVLDELRELRTGENKGEFRTKKIRFDGWVRPFLGLW